MSNMTILVIGAVLLTGCTTVPLRDPPDVLYVRQSTCELMAVVEDFRSGQYDRFWYRCKEVRGGQHD